MGKKKLADGGYYSGSNLKYITEEGIDFYIPTGKGDPGLAGRFGREDFIYEESTDSYRCPGGEKLFYKLSRWRNGIERKIYKCSSSKCRSCKLKSRCTTGRFRELWISEVWEHEREMKEKLSSKDGGRIYGRRKVMIEPVFGNMKFNLGFTRFVLRDLQRVKGEFLLMCIAHNLKKISQYWCKLRPAIRSKIALAGRTFIFLCLFLGILQKRLNRWTNLNLKTEYI